jgi:hypothetical protein
MQVVNFSGLRREYYIEELFVAARQEEVENEPEWAEHELSYDVIKKHNKQFVFVDYFDDNSTGWNLNNTSKGKVSIENGVLKIDGDNIDDLVYWKESALDCSADFEIEAKIKISGNDPYHIGGILWSGDGVDNAYMIAFNTSNNVLIYNTDLSYIYFYRFNQPTFNKDSYNKFTIRKLNGLYYFYLNEEFMYFTDVHEEFGNVMGFLVGKNTELLIDELHIAQINPVVPKSSIGHGNSYLNSILNLNLPGIRDLSN